MATSLNQVFDIHDVICSVSEFISDDSIHFGMLASVSKQFHLKFKQTAKEARKYREDTRLFVELRDFIIDDLTTKGSFEKDSNDEYNDETPEGYWTLFCNNRGVIVYVMRKTPDHTVSLSASNFRWEDFDIKNKEEWAPFSDLMDLQGPFKYMMDGTVAPASDADDDDSDFD